MSAGSSNLDISQHSSSGGAPPPSVAVESTAAVESEEYVSSLMTTMAVAVCRVAQARDRRDAAPACGWLLLSLTLATFEFVCLIALGVSLSWGHCWDSSECKQGMACVRYENENGQLLRPTCEDCYFLADGLPSGPDEPFRHYLTSKSHRIESTRVANASALCLSQLETASQMLQREHGSEHQLTFSKCLYVEHEYSKMSHLDELVMIFAMCLVALTIAHEWTEGHKVRLLRRICLPCTLLPMLPEGISCEAVARWAASWTLVLNEVVMQEIMLPVIPFGMIFLLLTQGAAAFQIILNGLAITFVSAIDNFIPLILLSDRQQAQVTRQLCRVARKGMRADRKAGVMVGRFTDHQHTNLLSTATAAVSLYVLIAGFYRVGNVNCEKLIHLVFYRGCIALGVWGATLVRALVLLLYYARSEAAKLTSKAAAYSAVRALVVEAVSHFAHALLAALVLNMTYWYCINVLYYADPKAEELFNDYVWSELFGVCARGPPWNAECIPRFPWP